MSSQIYADIEKEMGSSSSQEIQYTFDSDAFHTRIVRRGSELIGYDPTHPEGRLIVDYEQMIAAAASPPEAGNLKGWMMRDLMRRDLDMDTALQVIGVLLPQEMWRLPPPEPGSPQAAIATKYVDAMLARVRSRTATTPCG